MNMRHIGHRKFFVIVAALLGTAVVAGCGDDGKSATGATSDSPIRSALRVAVEPQDLEIDGIPAGHAMFGTIVDVNGCFGLAGEGGKSAILVFPKDSRVSSKDGATVVDVGGVLLTAGDSISFGLLSLVGLEKIDIPQSCKDGTTGYLIADVERS